MSEPIERCPRDPAHSHRPHAWWSNKGNRMHWCQGEVRCPTFHGMFPDRKGPHGECCSCPAASKGEGA